MLRWKKSFATLIARTHVKFQVLIGFILTTHRLPILVGKRWQKKVIKF